MRLVNVAGAEWMWLMSGYLRVSQVTDLEAEVLKAGDEVTRWVIGRSEKVIMTVS